MGFGSDGVSHRRTGYGFPARKRSGNTRGGDIEAELPVSIEEAFHGTQKQFTIRKADGTTKTYKVKIPEHSFAGKQIKLAGQGERQGTTTAGDLHS